MQDELRLSGCIEKVVLSTRTCIEALSAADDLGSPDCAAAVLLERHLRVLYGTVRKNAGNQSYMVVRKVFDQASSPLLFCFIPLAFIVP